MRIHRRYLLLGVALLALACLEIVFQPVRLQPRPKEFHIRFDFAKSLDQTVTAPEAKSDLSKYVTETVFKDFDDVTGAKRVGAAGLVLTCEKATRPEAQRLLKQVSAVIEKKIAKPREAVITDLSQLGTPPLKKLPLRLALYKPRPQIRLGLDLQGGSHIVLQVRQAFFEYKYEKPIGETDEERGVFLNNLREALLKSGVPDAEVKVKSAEPHTIQIHTQPRNEKTFNVQKELVVKVVNEQGAAANLGKAKRTRTPQFYSIRPTTLDQTVEILRRRVDGLGVSEATIQKEPPDRIIVELPGVKNPEEAKQAIGETAQLRFHLLPKEYEPVYHERERVTFRKGGQEVTSDEVFEASAKAFPKYVIKGDELEPNVQGGFSSKDTSEPAVHLNFRSKARNKFASMTTRHAPTGGEFWHIAIFLDRDCISAPRINEPIPGGAVEISGGFRSVEEANKLATQLNAGALPAPVDIVEERTISPTLGADSVRKSLNAGMMGLLCIVVFMLAWYRLPGVLAVVAVGVYCILNLAILVLAQATLTLPGIAGFILALGMSLDTNVLIFERLKEEMSTDKTFKSALQAAFHRAWTAIWDSHITTITAAIVLYNYGTGPIKGFGLTLIFGVISSLFTANTVTRWLMYAVADTGLANARGLWTPLRIWWGKFGRLATIKGEQPKPQFDLVGRRNLWFAISGLTIVVGIIFCAMNWQNPERRSLINLGIDFTGGALFQDRMPSNAVQGKSAPQFVGEVRVSLEEEQTLRRKIGNPQLAGGNVLFVRTQATTETEQRAQEKVVTRTLEEKYGKVELLSSELVGPVIGKELTRRAMIGVLLGCVLILGFIWLRYNVQHDGLRYAVAGIIAMLHDVLVMVGTFALIGYFVPSVEADSAFVAALLTVVGYSINDSVVIFDRIRENLKLRRRDPFDEIVNDSLWETMTRSINTGLNVQFTLIMLLLFGGGSIYNFILAMFIGITSGAYSSIFNASQILVAWRKWDEKRKAAATPQRRVEAKPEPQKPAPKPTTSAPRPVTAIKEPSSQLPTAPSTSVSAEDEGEEVEEVGVGATEEERARKRKAAKRGKRKRRF
jgi:SecD/SecF fusion protein